MLKSIMIIILIFVLAVAFYYIASPYQNCMRDVHIDEIWEGDIDPQIAAMCAERTGW